MNINLNTCIKGQKLRSKHGLILTYIGKTSEFPDRPEIQYYDHLVRYPSKYNRKSEGTRTNDGFVMRNKEIRLSSDHDIVEILPLDYRETKIDKEIKKKFLDELYGKSYK